MKELGKNRSGQVFTLDMFFALTLTALVVSYSGLALEQARRQAEEYALRYSLERTANDAADVLIKTLGQPENWAENAETLETLGFAEKKEGKLVPNTISILKFGQLRRLTNKDNWEAPVNAGAVEAIKKLFDGSEKFEVRVLDENGNELWHAYPRWDVENSGAENSAEVVVVRRPVAVRYGSAIKGYTGRLVGESAPWEKEENLEFWIYPGELDAFDFYIIVRGEGTNPRTKIWVNKAAVQPYKNPHYNFPTDPKVLEETFPKQHGGVENDSPKNVPTEYQLREENNFLGFWVKANPKKDESIRIYVVTLPSCSNWWDASLMIQPLPAILEVRMWR